MAIVLNSNGQYTPFKTYKSALKNPLSGLEKPKFLGKFLGILIGF